MSICSYEERGGGIWAGKGEGREREDRENVKSGAIIRENSQVLLEVGVKASLLGVFSLLKQTWGKYLGSCPICWSESPKRGPTICFGCHEEHPSNFLSAASI